MTSRPGETALVLTRNYYLLFFAYRKSTTYNQRKELTALVIICQGVPPPPGIAIGTTTATHKEYILFEFIMRQALALSGGLKPELQSGSLIRTRTP